MLFPRPAGSHKARTSHPSFPSLRFSLPAHSGRNYKSTFGSRGRVGVLAAFRFRESTDYVVLTRWGFVPSKKRKIPREGAGERCAKKDPQGTPPLGPRKFFRFRRRGGLIRRKREARFPWATPADCKAAALGSSSSAFERWLPAIKGTPGKPGSTSFRRWAIVQAAGWPAADFRSRCVVQIPSWSRIVFFGVAASIGFWRAQFLRNTPRKNQTRPCLNSR